MEIGIREDKHMIQDPSIMHIVVLIHKDAAVLYIPLPHLQSKL
jgi:hypothetical protein